MYTTGNTKYVTLRNSRHLQVGQERARQWSNKCESRGHLEKSDFVLGDI